MRHVAERENSEERAGVLNQRCDADHQVEPRVDLGLAQSLGFEVLTENESDEIKAEKANPPETNDTRERK